MSKEAITLNSGYKMPLVGLGTWPSSAGECMTAVCAALDAGYRHIDTATAYKNEEFIGEVLQEYFKAGKLKREEIFITTKLWVTYHEQHRVPLCLEQSLKKLKLEYVYLYLIHMPYAFRDTGRGSFYPVDENNKLAFQNVKVEETWKGMEQCVKNENAIGVSNFSMAQVDRFCKIAEILPCTNKEITEIQGSGIYEADTLIEWFYCRKRENKPEVLYDPVAQEMASKYNKTVGQFKEECWLSQEAPTQTEYKRIFSSEKDLNDRPFQNFLLEILERAIIPDRSVAGKRRSFSPLKTTGDWLAMSIFVYASCDRTYCYQCIIRYSDCEHWTAQSTYWTEYLVATDELAMAATELVFFVNGSKVVEPHPDPEVTLLQYLRNKLLLTGSKNGCGEGGCGACTVMVSRYNRDTDTISHYSVNACLAPVCSMHGLAVTTVEGIGSTRTGLHPVQERLAKSHGTQCGFCTPGIVMSMYTLLRNNKLPTRAEIENSLDGNLCRCTGYRPILQGFNSFAKDVCGMGEKCCKKNSSCKKVECGQRNLDNDVSRRGVVYDPTQEPIFPPELKTQAEKYATSLKFSTSRVTWYRPVTIEELLDLKSKNPDARLVVGNTEVGIEMRLKNMYYPVLISATHIPEFRRIERTNNGVTFGASVTLATMDSVLRQTIDNLPEYKTRIYKAFVEMLRWFAGHQVRNVASIGGNIITASPISDLNPLLVAAGATLTVVSKGKSPRTTVIDGNFFKGYRKITLDQDEVLLSVTIPTSSKTEYFNGFKQAHRKEDDISIVNAGMRVMFAEGTDVVDDISLVFGGMAPTTVLAKKTMAALKKQKWDEDLLKNACALLESDLPLPLGSPGGMEEYRQTLTTSFFFKFFMDVKQKIEKETKPVENEAVGEVSDAVGDLERGLSEGIQVFQDVDDGQDPDDAVGRPLVHLAALQQTTGEAIFVDDLRPLEGELYAALVISTKAHAKILSVDASDAQVMPGIKDFVSFKDIPGSTLFGILPGDAAEIFASEKVVHQGQAIGCIVGKTQMEAQRAAKKVKVCYEDLEPILTIEDAIKAESFFNKDEDISVESGDIETAFRESDHVIEGELRIGPQKHFYLETQAVVARPTNEDGGMEVISNSQFPAGVQVQVAKALGVQENKIVSRVKRIGGGFGGKESNPLLIAIPVAIAAHKLNCPVRGMLDREEDCIMAGGRHPFLAKYKVGFTNNGMIKAVDVQYFSNSGSRLDLSRPVMYKAIFSTDNACKIPNVRIRGRLCKTNTPTPTAFRAFGAPQGMLVTETWIERIAEVLNKPQHEIRQLNLYHENDVTFFGQEVKGSNIRKLWDDCMKQSDYLTRKKEVEDFNSRHRWKKRGISIIPTRFGISYPAPEKFLDQACALVTARMDGSVSLSHNGVEMGQGLHTKMIQVSDAAQHHAITWSSIRNHTNIQPKQWERGDGKYGVTATWKMISHTESYYESRNLPVASRALGIPASQIYTRDVCTETIHFTSCTAASMGADLNGGAVKNACEILVRRLEPFKKACPNGTFKDWVHAAYMERTHLSAAGYYRVESLDYDPRRKSGNFYFNYYTCGVGCSEVEIDCLTGHHQVLRTDIVMDVGKSLNPAIDIGQIEGAFMMGYGLYLLEQQKTNSTGTILTRGPGAYKIPSFANIPVKFNVTLLKDSGNPRAVYSSKAIGEPPLFLASSVFFAVKDAIKSARVDAGHSKEFRMDSPATPERIRMACQDQFTEQFSSSKKEKFTPWYVEL